MDVLQGMPVDDCALSIGQEGEGIMVRVFLVSVVSIFRKYLEFSAPSVSIRMEGLLHLGETADNESA